MGRLIEIFLVALKLGVTSFGGPVAHLGYFRDEYVVKRKWLSDKVYQDLVSLCQFLPGPASSQVGIGIGLMRGGLLGAVMAFLGFTLPSVAVLIVSVYLMKSMDMDLDFIKGLLLVAIAVVLHALVGMGKNTLKDRYSVLLFILSLLVALLMPSSITQIAIIVVTGCIGMLVFNVKAQNTTPLNVNVSHTVSITSLLLLTLLTFILPLMANISDNEWLHMFDKLFRGGLLVFGGGHVVLPLLQSAFVPEMLDLKTFLAGYGLTQAMPGPLFTFGSFIGTSFFGIKGGLVAMLAIFLPAFLLVIGTLPYWAKMREHRLMAQALKGINAGVLGILAAAWINPMILHTVNHWMDVVLSTLLFGLLYFLKLPPWVIVVLGIMIGFVFYR
ncbi:chromate efflux transporter [Macrococcoides caseolyticum]|uniref:chromate efflux transporter n=1 Tax=Macrococcoides caseolyticum TaxID=69966 RepID=UPI001F360B85|nr:chromate efflux transporter [Macrococcus caseolyticus]MCE4957298.1 chromate efflux transporter [Macrococcus caseolyticus]